MKLSLKLMIAVTLCALNLSVGWAQRQYPGSPGLPEDVVWMREIYRTLDLTKDTNGADRKSTRLNSSHQIISYAVFCLKKLCPERLSSLRE